MDSQRLLVVAPSTSDTSDLQALQDTPPGTPPDEGSPVPSSKTRFEHLETPDLERYLEGRKITDVSFPVQHRLTVHELLNPRGVPDLKRLREHFEGEGRLDMECLLRIVNGATTLMSREKNIVRVEGTVKVLGAICGQFFDLLKILMKIDFKAGEKGVFLGKYAWDGSFSTETVLYLYAHKLVYPKSVFLLRSQRETRLCSKTTFKTECQVKYNVDIYEDFSRSFEHLPLAAIVNEDTICVHGGFSPKAITLAEIDKINRFEEPPPRGALTDILWSDPDPSFGTNNDTKPCFTFNEERYISVYFTYQAFRNFMKCNNLSCLVRANQPLFNGFFEYPVPAQARGMRPLSMKAIFSAPNFKGKRNQGAMLVLTPRGYYVEKFLWVEPPYWLPNFADCFTWSLPFLVRKATLFVSDLLEFMDRDTAASDVRAALKMHQERTNVRSAVTKDSAEGENDIAGPQRNVVFSTDADIVGDDTRPPLDEELGSEEESESKGIPFQLRPERWVSLRMCCCPGQAELSEKEED